MFLCAKGSFSTTILLLSSIFLSVGSVHIQILNAQSVQVGKGSYTTALPPGAVGPQRANGAPVSPKISASFNKPVQTNHFWSSLTFPFFGDPHSNNLFAHPLLLRARNNGMQMGYTASSSLIASDYVYQFSQQLTVGMVGLNAATTLTDDYSDWTATALWQDGPRVMRATFGHGLPFVYFEMNGADAQIITSVTPTIWHNQQEVLGITVEGRHYGIFAPVGSTWSTAGALTSSLNGKNYLSVVLLPDNQLSTLTLFKQHAYAFVTDSKVSWTYNEATANLETEYLYETELKETEGDYVNETLTALYRHQYMYSNATLSSHTYQSARGVMKLFVGNRFTTDIHFSGILPALPDLGEYNRATLINHIKAVATETLPLGPTYENGKLMNRFAQLVNIADQMGAIEERDHFLSELKKRLEVWLTAGGPQQYVYNSEWNVLTGYPSGYGADNQINDHHFHSAYAIMSAAIIAQFDPDWARQENWGGMINLLIKDSNNWDRTDTMFPFLRSHDAYAGHSWAAGHADFADGNNQESSSESMNFASAVFLWGNITHQKEIRDLGIFLHTNETTAIEQYWFDVHHQVFPSNFNHVAVGMVWGGKASHATWFGANPEFIHGINLLPIGPGSLYLGRHPEYVVANFNEIVAEGGGQINIWKDVIWQYLALGDATLANALYYADSNYQPFDGESRAHTLHWLGNLKRIGQLDTTVSASVPSYSVFKDAVGNRTYAAFNPEDTSVMVHFSDGYSMEVQAGKMRYKYTGTSEDDAPVAILSTSSTRGKAPLTVSFDASNSFDRDGEQVSFYWDFGNGVTSSRADTSVIYVDPGEYKVMLSVTNERNITARDSVVIAVFNNGTPFSGTPFLVPGRLEGENYDEGGQGVAYNDVDANNIGMAYRPNEGVDIIAIGGGFAVYWMVNGEWMEYTIEVPTEGDYNIVPYMSTVPAFGHFRLYVDNKDVSGRVNVTSTGGWETFRPFAVNNVPLTAGVHILRIEVGSDTDKTGWLYSLDYFMITSSSTVSIEEPGVQVPSELSLSQNYPNPFNPVTSVNFSLPVNQKVVLEVFDLLGRTMMVVKNQILSAGHHTVSIDARTWPSGVYMYRLQTEKSGTITKKMMLVK